MTKKDLERLAVGNIYYKQCSYDCKSCFKVQVVEIIDDKKVMVKGLTKSKKGKKEADPFVTSIASLHTKPGKATGGYRQHHKK